jgi:hypothetical protein
MISHRSQSSCLANRKRFAFQLPVPVVGFRPAGFMRKEESPPFFRQDQKMLIAPRAD